MKRAKQIRKQEEMPKFYESRQKGKCWRKIKKYL